MNAVAVDESGVPAIEQQVIAALAAAGRLKEADLQRARQLHAEQGGSLLALLVRLGLVSERDQAATTASVLGLPLLEARQVADDSPALLAELPDLPLRFLK